ncbi:hypothetical protein ATERTT37_001599 [Aspergillus terreus]
MPEIGGKEVGPIGFGLMGLTWRATPPTQEQAFAAMRAAIKNGCTCWNGGEFYGPPDYNSLVLLERYLEKYPEDADKIVLNIKGGANPKTHQVDASPENTRRTLDDCIAQLKGRKKIDMFEFGRRDPAVPLDVTFGLIEKEYIQTGKIGGIALSEVRAETIHEAVKHTNVVAVEAELSLGMLTGQFKKFDDLPQDSLLLSFNFPRFRRENFEKNVQLVEKVEEIAKKKGCTPAQLAINWTRALSRRPGMPTIIPIPGATTTERVEENSKLIDISDAEMAEIDDILTKFTPAGGRYPEIFQVNT